MNSHSVKNNNNNKDRKAKAIAAAIPIAGVVVAAAFLSGLSLINSYQPAIAQNMTGNATTPTPPTTGGGTSAQSACAPIQRGGIPSASEVREHIEEACMAAQGNDTEGVLWHLNLALNALGGNMTTTEGGEDEGGEDEG